jgi:hypothetical protein
VWFAHLVFLLLWGCHSHKESPKPLEQSGIADAEQQRTDVEVMPDHARIDSSGDEVFRLWLESASTGASAIVAALRAGPDPPTSPMFHAYPGATEGHDLTLKIENGVLRQSTVTPDLHAVQNGCLSTPYVALAIPLRLSNSGSAPLSLTVPHEWHGGAWAATDLYACVRERTASAAAAEGKWACQQLYQLRERYELAKQDSVRPGTRLRIIVRMDWEGTPSMRGIALMPTGKAASYEVQVIAFYRQRQNWHFTIGPSTLVRVEM